MSSTSAEAVGQWHSFYPSPMVLIPTMYCTVGGEVLLAEGVISLLLQVFPSSLVDFP